MNADVCFNRRGDSLGGAAMMPGIASMMGCSFNRRGDSLGGAALRRLKKIGERVVSIAGAILWGVLRTPALRSAASPAAVSIAGAILWGVLLS